MGESTCTARGAILPPAMRGRGYPGDSRTVAPRGQRESFSGGCHCRRVEQWSVHPPDQARRRDGVCPRRRSRPNGWVRAKPKVTIAYRREPNGPACDLPFQVQSAEALTWRVLTPLWRESSDYAITRGDVWHVLWQCHKRVTSKNAASGGQRGRYRDSSTTATARSCRQLGNAGIGRASATGSRPALRVVAENLEPGSCSRGERRRTFFPMGESRRFPAPHSCATGPIARH